MVRGPPSPSPSLVLLFSCRDEEAWSDMGTEISFDRQGFGAQFFRFCSLPPFVLRSGAMASRMVTEYGCQD